MFENKKQKYNFFVSKVFGSQNNPFRGSNKRTGTIRKLLNIWQKTFSKPFTFNSILEKEEEVGFDVEAWEAQARKDSAWGAYSAHIRHQDEIEEYRAAEKLPESERKKEIERLNNRTNHLVIG
jgi:hypothetical protein